MDGFVKGALVLALVLLMLMCAFMQGRGEIDVLDFLAWAFGMGAFGVMIHDW